MMNKTTALTKLKPLFLLSLFTVFNGNHASAQASLSSHQPISSRIVATAATPEQIQATAATQAQAQVQAITAPSVKTSTLSGESHHVANQKINKFIVNGRERVIVWAVQVAVALIVLPLYKRQ